MDNLCRAWHCRTWITLMGLLSGLFGYNGGGLLGGGGDENSYPENYTQGMAPRRMGPLEGFTDSLNSPLFQFGMGLASGATPQEGFGNALSALQVRQKLAQSNLTSDIKEYQFDMAQRIARGEDRIPFGEWQRQQANLREQFGLNVIPYYDRNTGEYRLGQASSRGGFRPLDIPGSATDQSQVIQTPQGAIIAPKRIVPNAGVPSPPPPAETGAMPGSPGQIPTQGFIKKNYEGPEEEKGVGGGYAKEFNSIQDDGRKALAMKNTYSRMSQLNDEAYQGAGAPGVQYARSLLATAGVDPGKVPAGEELTQLSNRLVLDATGGSLGNQISNADRDYIQATNPSLANTREGRARMIDVGMKLADRKVETARLASQWRAEKGSMKGFDQFMAKYAEEHPLFPKTERANGGTTRSGIKWSID